MQDAHLLLGTEPQYQVQKYVFNLNIHSTSHKLLCLLDSYRNTKTGAPGYPGVKLLAKRMRVTDRTVQNHLKRLEDAGYIKRQYCFQVIEGGIARQTTSYCHLTKLTIGAAELAGQILALKLPKVVTPNKVRKLRQSNAPQGLPVHPPGEILFTPINYISKNPPVPNMDETPYINTTNIPGRDLSSCQNIASLMAETQAVVDAVPKVDLIKEQEGAEIIIEGYEGEMGAVSPKHREAYIKRYAASDTPKPEALRAMATITKCPILKLTTFSPMRAFAIEHATRDRDYLIGELRRAFSRAESYGQDPFKFALMTKGLGRFCGDRPDVMRAVIETVWNDTHQRRHIDDAQNEMDAWCAGQGINVTYI